MKHLLTLTDLTKNEISNILEVATQMRRIVASNYKKGPQLIGNVVAGVFSNNSLASTAMQLATTYLSGSAFPVFDVNDVLAQCQTFDSMGVNTLVIACANDNLAKSFAGKSRCGVINGGSSQYDPVGVLADLMALNARLDGLQNLNVLAVGNRDVNKINELNHCLQLFGSNMIWYLPPDDFVTTRKGIVLDKADAAFSGADAVIDLGLAAFSDPEKYYGSVGGISEAYMDKASIRCPLLGSRYVVDKVGIKEYAHNIVSARETCYVSVLMAVLYLMRRE